MLINPVDIVDGVLASAITATASMLARPRTSRRTSAEMEIAGWLDTGWLTEAGRRGDDPPLPALPAADAEALSAALRGNEVQGALQALLAARLTGAPETDATRARETVRRAIAAAGPAAAQHAEPLSDYYDDRICALVGHLEDSAGLPALSQVRSEAYSSRIVDLLGAIERQLAAIAHPDHGGQAEADFLARYRRQVRERHGKIEPPDFERRRRVPVGKIYVNTDVFTHPDPRVQFGWHPAGRARLQVLQLAGRIDRTVLLGDPGGGKTTATSVLANHFAGDPAGKVPFIVTLRDYAATEPPERSVLGHIEHTLETLYQCAPPGDLVWRLLMTGRAIVIFDGLDELLDTARRRDVSERVEQFCTAYPLTAVLVTSRVVGYDQARLDDDRFACYRLGGFGNDEVSEYVNKWFALQEGTSLTEASTEAAAFLAESAGAPDLRYNPLLLSLMCILYRGAGSLPRDRAGIYAKCAELLLTKWDERRRIHHELQAGHLVEPAIRHLARWLLDGDDPRAAVTERALVEEAATFLHRRGFETSDEARAAARKFVEFCRGRLWVLSETGTTADGERLYSFTHRTFLEYFAAAQLAIAADTPEDLARDLAPRVITPKGENLVAELAIQIKDRASDRGADRIFAALLDPALTTRDLGPLLTFLADCLKSVRPAPATVRTLTRAMLGYRLEEGSLLLDCHPLICLLRAGDPYESQIADELTRNILDMVTSGDPPARIFALQVILEINCWRANGRTDALRANWIRWSQDQAQHYTAEIAAEADRMSQLRCRALEAGIISLEQALALPGGFAALMQFNPAVLSTLVNHPYPVSFYPQGPHSHYPPDSRLAAIGRHLADNPALPWGKDTPYDFTYTVARPKPEDISKKYDELSTLGAAAIGAVYHELALHFFAREDFWRLPMPDSFKELFKAWAEGRVNFVEAAASSSSPPGGGEPRSLCMGFGGFLEHGEVAV